MELRVVETINTRMNEEAPPSPPRLARIRLIQVLPKCDIKAVIIARLKWLESLDCRTIMMEEDRTIERRRVTEIFRNRLAAEEAQKSTSAMEVED